MKGFLATGVIVATMFGSIPEAGAESPRNMMLELHFGLYGPEVDNGFQGGSPYKDSFGESSLLMLKLYADYQLWQDVGSVAIGLGWGYGWVDGKAIEEGSSDETGLNIMPLSVGITYRFDYLAIEYEVPLVPYVKAGFTWAIWWITNGKNDIANTYGGPNRNEARLGWSNTFGFFAGGGLQVLLDFFSRDMATSFDEEMGVNNSYLFAEVVRYELNDFYSASSINLSETAFSFGLMFEF